MSIVRWIGRHGATKGTNIRDPALFRTDGLHGVMNESGRGRRTAVAALGGCRLLILPGETEYEVGPALSSTESVTKPL